ncbi:ImmA/IrrE family metallo-endopeptidase [Bradyrhizobium sp. SBR1B]|uniref:ImmA/IrrE family metallo-endopeptidase n=1 Tax=Bradyrhizobium sp. SBR1B TaxID=2663836 RepID=UPI0024BFFAC9|nr:ImmA/IrrE family metallo-endopeptidase [Bradyrhizobium sp. SBR1B]
MSRSLFPEDPITKVAAEELDGFAGALVPSESKTKWGIVFGADQSRGRRRFTIAHEFGHYLLHSREIPRWDPLRRSRRRRTNQAADRKGGQ